MKMNIPTLVSLLAFSPILTLIIASSSASHLERRKDKHPLNHFYTMKQQIDYSEGPLKIYAADGTVAYRFAKVSFDSSDQGLSTTELQTDSSKVVLTLQSTNDLCAQKTTYEEAQSPRSRTRRVEIYPRGMLKDVWRLNYVDDSGVRHNFRFKRGFADSGGRIYTQVNGHDGELIAELKNEKRKDSWLTQGSKSKEVRVLTLSCTEDSPREQLIAFMALVLSRVDRCGF
ncbi:hypothetical protein PGT21_037043 [Puccinia graminis f. sp. tritici]|uniref:Uncharacterized protein n=1 Tax=Puccinia graminis f. sp. tritici TaxID=56615 RepID=A0A5B0QRL7_PUCGR|nr:hypothetical protein PGT21_037043 [Puccinia graminis f. sp. tritici]